jgi:hypothetical protein
VIPRAQFVQHIRQFGGPASNSCSLGKLRMVVINQSTIYDRVFSRA